MREKKIEEIIYGKCGCTDSSIEAVAELTALIASEQKPMVEALKEAKKQILHIEDKCNKTYDSSDMVLAKIDAVLEGKCQETK